MVPEIMRNMDLDANGWWNNYQGAAKGRDTQNDFGAEVAGPVWIPKLYNGKNKTFFMFNTEFYRYKSTGNGLTTVPDASWVKGDFSNLLQPTTVLGQVRAAHTIYDWTTCTPGPCQAFPRKIIHRRKVGGVLANAVHESPAGRIRKSRDVLAQFRFFLVRFFERSARLVVEAEIFLNAVGNQRRNVRFYPFPRLFHITPHRECRLEISGDLQNYHAQ